MTPAEHRTMDETRAGVRAAAAVAEAMSDVPAEVAEAIRGIEPPAEEET